MKNRAKKTFFKITLLCLIGCYSSAYASPATPAMIDAEGCHTCNKVCSKFGLKNGDKHCHVFSPVAMEIYIKAAAGSAANPETMYANNVLSAMNYVSMDESKSHLIIAPATKQIEGSYGVVQQSCGFGGKNVAITKGAPPVGAKNIFGLPYNGKLDGVYQVTIDDRNFVGLATADARLLVVNQKDEIGCSGQFIRENLYIYCKSDISAKKSIVSSGYCRTSLSKH